MTIHTNLWCSECGEIRVRTPTGMVCPNSHGRIFPPATANQVKAAKRLKWSKSLPRASRDGRRGYIISGHPGKYRIVRFRDSRRVPTGATCDDGVLAVILGKNIQVRKFVPLE